MRVGGFLILLLLSGWIYSWTFGFVWLNKMAVVLPEVSKIKV